MEYAYWKGKLISASKIIEEKYIIEKRIREASNKKELLYLADYTDGKIQLDLETFKFDRTETPTRNYERRQRRRK